MMRCVLSRRNEFLTKIRHEIINFWLKIYLQLWNVFVRSRRDGFCYWIITLRITDIFYFIETRLRENNEQFSFQFHNSLEEMVSLMHNRMLLYRKFSLNLLKNRISLKNDGRSEILSLQWNLWDVEKTREEVRYSIDTLCGGIENENCKNGNWKNSLFIDQQHTMNFSIKLWLYQLFQ